VEVVSTCSPSGDVAGTIDDAKMAGILLWSWTAEDMNAWNKNTPCQHDDVVRPAIPTDKLVPEKEAKSTRVPTLVPPSPLNTYFLWGFQLRLSTVPECHNSPFSCL
jgi:hypothetical protein